MLADMYLSFPAASTTIAPGSSGAMRRARRASYSLAEMPGVSSPGASRWGCVAGSGWP